ncbi:UNVERIFIED_CONTAM: hypothetical protein PYX00_006809 [Menopon gallinae]|uniref:RING-CH-type domain-containing protein n=1 Tax=Menopon gallinae TaxID=328185 RepID=A0AAW2HWF8_9NEOP
MASDVSASAPTVSPAKDDNVKEVILTVNIPSLLMNLQTVSPLCTQTHHITHQRLSYSGPGCRICHEGGVQEELISPCMCAGTLGLAHATCIEKWLSSSNTTICEICKYQYNLIRQPKSVVEWLQTRSPHNGPSGFCGDVFCLLLLTPLCIGSVYLCAVGAQAYIKHGLWEGTGLALLCCFLTAVYIMWCFVAVRFHWKRFRRWQMTNQTVHLLNKFCPEKGMPAAETS